MKSRSNTPSIPCWSRGWPDGAPGRTQHSAPRVWPGLAVLRPAHATQRGGGYARAPYSPPGGVKCAQVQEASTGSAGKGRPTRVLPTQGGAIWGPVGFAHLGIFSGARLHGLCAHGAGGLVFRGFGPAQGFPAGRPEERWRGARRQGDAPGLQVQGFCWGACAGDVESEKVPWPAGARGALEENAPVHLPVFPV